MPNFQCPVCHGTYADPQPDGMKYFHACPPLSLAELAVLPVAQLAALMPDLPLGTLLPAYLTAAIHRTFERPGKRDENIVTGFAYPPRNVGDVSPYPPPTAIQDQPPRIAL